MAFIRPPSGDALGCYEVVTQGHKSQGAIILRRITETLCCCNNVLVIKKSIEQHILGRYITHEFIKLFWALSLKKMKRIFFIPKANGKGDFASWIQPTKNWQHLLDQRNRFFFLFYFIYAFYIFRFLIICITLTYFVLKVFSFKLAYIVFWCRGK